jgi:hypothetical protein
LRAILTNTGVQLSALAGLTAATLQGLNGFGDERVHVLVGRGARVAAQDGVVVHESRRFHHADIHPSRALRMTTLERALIDAAAWDPAPRRACGILAAAVQQRITTAPRLRDALGSAGRLRHRRLLLLALGDIEGGAQSLAEIDFGRLCRRAGLPSPLRQQVRIDGQGRRRYLDATMRRADGTEYDVEVDGAHHLEERSYWDDMTRSNDLTIGGRSLLRFPVLALRIDRGRVMAQLRRMHERGV